MPHIIATIHRVDEQDYFENPEKWCITWRSYLKKTKACDPIK